MEQVFTIDLILEAILGNLAFQDLLALSVVNKKLNYLARKRLYEHHKCTVKISNQKRLKMERPCERMRALDALLENSTNAPFNGLILKIDDHEFYKDESSDFHYCIPSLTNVTRLYPSIWNKLVLKYLVVSCDFKCPAGEIVKRIMIQKGESIESLNIKSMKRKRVFCKENQIVELTERKFNLGNLKFLEIHKNMDPELLNDILVSSPNIQDIWGTVHCNEVATLLKNNAGNKLREFYLIHNEEFVRGFGLVVKPIETHVCGELVKLQPKLRKIVAKYEQRSSGCGIESFCDILAGLMKSSSDSLEALEIDQLSLIWMASRELSQARNLKEIRIGYVDAIDYDAEMSTLSKINFGSMFPRLEKVSIKQAWGVVADSNGFIPAEFLNFSGKNLHPGVKSVTLTASLKERLSALVRDLFPSATLTVE